jgi:hypothetical protein
MFPVCACSLAFVYCLLSLTLYALCVQKGPPLIPILSQMNPVHILTTLSLGSILILSHLEQTRFIFRFA